MHKREIHTAGKELREAKKVLVLLHGRGGSAKEFLSLANHLNTKDFAILAPQATDFTWYPNSFLTPVQQNEPELASALALLKGLLEDIIESGVATENIYFAGFSQGACLSLEFVARHAQKFGGVIAFTGGLIGEELDSKKYSGDFKGTPILISSGDPDAHIPTKRIENSVEILKKMNASVQYNLYKNKTHSISEEEIEIANQVIFS